MCGWPIFSNFDGLFFVKFVSENFSNIKISYYGAFRWPQYHDNKNVFV